MKAIKSLLIFTFLIGSIKAYSHSVKKLPNVKERNIHLKLTCKFSVKGHADSIILTMPYPKTINNRQIINDVSFSEDPTKIYTQGKNSYAVFKFYDVEKNFKITLKANITLIQTIDTATTKSIDTLISRYLIPEYFIQSDNAEIIKVAETLKQKSDIETIMTTFTYVKEHITYKVRPSQGAEGVLESGIGKCTDFSNLFVALLRANKIPAKSVQGMTVEYSNTPFHAWSEAYLKKQGWIQFDPTEGQSSIRQEGKNFVMSIKNKYIIFSEGKNESGIWSYRWGSNSSCSVSSKSSYTMEDY